MPTWQQGLIGVLLVMAAAKGLGVTTSLSRWLMDVHWRWQTALRPPAFPDDIVIVAIDDKSVQRLGRLRYWSRRRYAELLDHLRHAKAVGIDILFAEPDERDLAGDEALAQALRRHGRVVLPFYQWQGRLLSAQGRQATERLMTKLPAAPRGVILPVTFAAAFQPPLSPLLDAAVAVGYADVNADPDGVYRAPVLLRQTNAGKLMPHFALAVACVAQGVPLDDAVHPNPLTLRWGQRRISLDDGVLHLRPIARRSDRFTGVGASVPTVSFVDALTMPPEKFAGKIVLVGETATGTTDIRPTPLDNGLRGVELNAEILANLLHLPPVRPLPLALQWLLIALAVGAPCWLYTTMGVRPATVGATAALLGLIAAMEGAFWWGQRLPQWGTPLMAWLSATLLMGLHRLAQEEAQKRQIRQTFSLYVAPELVEEIVQNPATAHQEGVRRRVAVLFSDIRGFTTYSEQNPPELVVRQMREYLTEMTAAVQNHRGVLDKFIGDAVMGLFGPFLPDDANLSALAVASALEMLERLERLNVHWQRQGLPTFRIGIGVHVGEAMVGNIGSAQRVQYTALGDTVNLAARLQTMTKDFQAPLIVSEAVRDESEKALGDAVAFTDLGSVTVRGRAQPVRVFAVRRRHASQEVTSDVAPVRQDQAPK
ncbi:Adenylate cyclase 1 [bacterium HR17]|uniref:Adenylate cyclase 1 n=1 Tax=Candidatus Fervidibacter japonicus TaxID=2035412 RepID=A0A2H5XEH5_9BACT|nr:Adenylate cyclase 1 [bacterium HR17]